MPIETFKQAFGRYTVTMYSDNWQTKHKKANGETDSKFSYYFENPVEQEVVIGFDQTPPRMYGDSCEAPHSNYNLLVFDHAGTKLRHKAVAPQVNYGQAHFDKLPPGEYTFKVINFGNVSAPSDFALTTYARKQPIELRSSSDVVLAEMNHIDP